jgi:plastocyanin
MARKTVALVAVFVVLVIGFNAAYLQSLPTTRHITVEGYDFFFTVPGMQGNNPTITVRTGDTVVLTLKNLGTQNDHEFFILTKADFDNYTTALKTGENASEPEPAFQNGSVEDVPAGESKTGTFVVGPPGTYVYACLDKMGTEPLTHANKGMYGTLQVESGGLFSIVQSMNGMLGGTLGSAVTSIPSIVIWQVAILLSLAVLIKREK